MLARGHLVLGGQQTLETRVCGLVAALTEVRLNVVGVQVLVNLRTLALGHAVHGPGVHEVRGVGEVRTRIDVPILGSHDSVIAVVVVLHELANERSHFGAARGRQGTALAEVVLHVHNNQCLRHSRPYKPFLYGHE